MERTKEVNIPKGGKISVVDENEKDVTEEFFKDAVEAPDPDEGKVKWRKIGGGTFRMSKNRIIKQNQTFMARPDEIPMQFRDVVVPVEPLLPEKALRVVSQKYEVKSDKSPGWYNVFDGNGKQLNERRMKQDAAAILVASLEGAKVELKKLSVKPDKSAGWFNVFDGTGKQLNTRRMRKAAAETMAGGPES